MAKRGRRARIALWIAGVALAIVVLGFTFQTVWIRPLVQSYVRQHAGRDIQFDSIRIGLDRSARPSVTLRQLEVQNASWASSRAPLIRAEAMAMTLPWNILWANPKVITRMVLRDAEIDLERQADGLRNWRLNRPDDKGPGRVRVLVLDAQRSHLRFVHGGLGLELALASQPVAGASTDKSPNQMVSLQGTRHGVEFHGRFQTPAELSLYDTGSWFDLQGELATADMKLGIKGRVHDLIQLGGLDADLHAAGDQFGQLGTVFSRYPLKLPALPVKADAHLLKDGEHWSVTALSGRLGGSDLAGTLDYRSNRAADGRPQWRATLASEKVDLTPWRSQAVKPAAAAAAASAAEGAWRRAADLDLDWHVKALQGLPRPVTDLHAVLSARSGLWRLAPLEWGIAGGRVSGEASYDATAASPTTGTDLRIERLRLDQLGGSQVGGRLDGHLTLQSHGETVAALLAGASGDASATLVGASLPATMEAKLGLDGGRWLEAVLSGGDRRPVTCSALQLHLAQGVAQVRRLRLETDALLVDGVGQIDLPARAIDLTLTPFRKQETVLSLDRSVQVKGTAGAFKVALVPTPAGTKREPCVAVATP